MKKVELQLYETIIQELPKIAKALQVIAKESEKPSDLLNGLNAKQLERQLEWYEYFGEKVNNLDAEINDIACEFADNRAELEYGKYTK
jgi:hypothetical protein|tara:strand:- start:1034 stop:1297 length:264 start_codon:yes stop_codon:yes gene_type:complete